MHGTDIEFETLNHSSRALLVALDKLRRRLEHCRGEVESAKERVRDITQIIRTGGGSAYISQLANAAFRDLTGVPTVLALVERELREAAGWARAEAEMGAIGLVG